jgi:hypothetical protein
MYGLVWYYLTLYAIVIDATNIPLHCPFLPSIPQLAHVAFHSAIRHLYRLRSYPQVHEPFSHLAQSGSSINLTPVPALAVFRS